MIKKKGTKYKNAKHKNDRKAFHSHTDANPCPSKKHKATFKRLEIDCAQKLCQYISTNYRQMVSKKRVYQKIINEDASCNDQSFVENVHAAQRKDKNKNPFLFRKM